MRLAALTAALVLAAAPAVAQDAIEDVISSQLEAFNDRDVGTAWSFASPMIRGMFGTPGNFGEMVEQGYPMVWTNSEARFLQREPRGERQVQRVMVTDAEGAIHMLDYYMVETPQGWQIDGVTLLPAPELGV
ncbi:DUF4864 domain-containing protein [Wenxinia saemankumensis]|uniref:DUF4864 domain-containing protein n=1 Tax=Wenxinia saemankumensis TaxID=1447782 RepID=A0A1M6EQ40_9RHOB|nr:DUF4864 domain-containing protein [Wenxinia saemankumensis]SHI87526.1 protein of unknown function [Wenxinia saemankumensis]